MRRSADCAGCGKPLHSGSMAWYANSREAGYRCTACGQHDESDVGPGGSRWRSRGPTVTVGAAAATLATRTENAAVRDGDGVYRTELESTAEVIEKALADYAQNEPPAATPRKATGLFADKYRPADLAGVKGQADALAFLAGFAAEPFPAALLFTGATGTGKTTAAIALAAEIGCDVDEAEFGGLTVIISGEQTSETIRKTYEGQWHIPMYGSGWKVVAVNEADRMNPNAETIWLDRLEALPPRTVFVFTTNFPEKLSQRFRDRCMELVFVSTAKAMRPAAIDLACDIFRAEVGRLPGEPAMERMLAAAAGEGEWSLRRLVTAAQMEVARERATGRSKR